MELEHVAECSSPKNRYSSLFTGFAREPECHPMLGRYPEIPSKFLEACVTELDEWAGCTERGALRFKNRRLDGLRVSIEARRITLQAPEAKGDETTMR
jgi:hypothetical protein